MYNYISAILDDLAVEQLGKDEIDSLKQMIKKLENKKITSIIKNDLSTNTKYMKNNTLRSLIQSIRVIDYDLEYVGYWIRFRYEIKINDMITILSHGVGPDDDVRNCPFYYIVNNCDGTIETNDDDENDDFDAAECSKVCDETVDKIYKILDTSVKKDLLEGFLRHIICANWKDEIK